VEVGDLVTLEASVHFVGKTSMVIGIEVHAENTVKGEIRHTNTSFVTMVAQDEHGVSRQVPPLLLETEAEIRNFHAAMARREANKSLRNTLDVMKTDLDLDLVLPKLKPYRCVIQRQ
jgi:acyl-CoA hydrolase